MMKTIILTNGKENRIVFISSMEFHKLIKNGWKPSKEDGKVQQNPQKDDENPQKNEPKHKGRPKKIK